MRTLIVLLVTLHASVAAASPRLAVIDTARLWEKGGIARYVAAVERLAEERKKFKLVESPDGKTVRPARETDDERLRRIQRELDHLQRDSRERQEWEKREREVLEPIESDVVRALGAFAKKRGIDLLLDRDAYEGLVLYAAPSLDLTAAFIADYNRAKPR
jgi:Skp family chaperone for outer membrane proteins